MVNQIKTTIVFSIAFFLCINIYAASFLKKTNAKRNRVNNIIVKVAKKIHKEIEHLSQNSNKNNLIIILFEPVYNNVSLRNQKALQLSFISEYLNYLNNISDSKIIYKDEKVLSRLWSSYKTDMEIAIRNPESDRAKTIFNKFFSETSSDYIVVTEIDEKQNKIYFTAYLFGDYSANEVITEYMKKDIFEIDKKVAIMEMGIYSSKYDTTYSTLIKKNKYRIENVSNEEQHVELNIQLKDPWYNMRGYFVYQPQKIVDESDPYYNLHYQYQELGFSASAIPIGTSLFNISLKGSAILAWNLWDAKRKKPSGFITYNDFEQVFHKKTYGLSLGTGIVLGDLNNGLELSVSQMYGEIEDDTAYEYFPLNVLKFDRKMANLWLTTYSVNWEHYTGKLQISANLNIDKANVTYNGKYYGFDFKSTYSQYRANLKLFYYFSKYRLGLLGSYYEVNKEAIDKYRIFLNDRMNGFDIGFSFGYMFRQSD